MGRYREAVKHLNSAAATSGDAALRSIALHEAGVASFFSGDFEVALRLANAALDANPDTCPRASGPGSPRKGSRLSGPGGRPQPHGDVSGPSSQPRWNTKRFPLALVSTKPAAAVESRYSTTTTTDGSTSPSPARMGASAFIATTATAPSPTSVLRAVCIVAPMDSESRAGDYENSGYPGLAVCRAGFFGGMVELWRNNGDGTSTDVSVESGVSCWGPSFTCSWCDYDRDGKLDLFVCSNIGGLFDRRTPHKLFHNNGDGTFTEVAAQAGIVSRWPAIGHTWGDYNNDGYPDLFLSNTIGEPQLFRNNGNGSFTDVTAESGLDLPVMAFNAHPAMSTTMAGSTLSSTRGARIRTRSIRCKRARPRRTGIPHACIATTAMVLLR